MLITKTSIMSGITRSLELDVTIEQIAAYHSKTYLLQDAFPNLDADEREFMKTGITSEEWNDMFGDCDDEDEGEPDEPTEEDKALLINPKVQHKHDNVGHCVWVIAGDNGFEYKYFDNEPEADSELAAIIGERDDEAEEAEEEA